jgi:hypothetical protein
VASGKLGTVTAAFGTTGPERRLRNVAVVLLALAAGLFVLGTGIERNRHREPAAAVSVESHEDAEEPTAPAEGNERPGAAYAGEEAEATIFGVQRESTGLVVIAVITLLALAAFVLARPGRPTWVLVGLGATTFAAFDIVEIVHQVNESAPGLVALAATIAAAHVSVGAISVQGLRLRPQR